MYYVGIDVGGTNLKAGVVDEQGKIISKVDCPTQVERGHEAVVENMAHLALKAIEKAGVSLDEVKSIGIGIPGVLDPRTGRVPFCTNLGWHDVPVIQLMQKVIDKPVFVDNDATVATLAENVAGVSAGAKSSVFLTLGTGVGGGVVIDGKVYSGAHGVGSELGHMITVAGGELCTCGNRGCWERYASATALIRAGRVLCAEKPSCTLMKHVDGDIRTITAKDVIDLAMAGDADCVKIFDDYIYHLVVGLTNLINVYDPEVIVLGGGVSHCGDFLLNAVRSLLPK